MPDDRFLHPRLRMSVKVSTLSWLERCVWEDMILAADDFGVLPDRAGLIRGANDAFSARESEASIAASMETVVRVGLFLRFDHQRQGFLCDPAWQDFQKIHYPRRTYYPSPPAELLHRLSRKTQELLRKHPSNISKKHSIQSRAGHRLTANGIRQEAQEGGVGETPAFDGFYALYPRKVGRDAAERAWRAAVKRAQPAVIMASLERQRAELAQREPRFIPHPATWLNQGRWQDEPPDPARGLVRPATAAAVRRFAGETP